MQRKLLSLLLLWMSAGGLQAQISARLMRYMDVSETQITFVYGGDIWIMPREGGLAVPLTNSPGEESWPRFSPNGKEIAFSASYNGNVDVFVMPVTGGLPQRVTWHSGADRLLDWHPDGERLLFASRRELGQRSSNQFFVVSKFGGMPEKLPLPYGELASWSPDGKQLAYITKITENYPFKRYRGGLTSDILLFDSQKQQVTNLTNSKAIDGKPAWVGDKIYFLSDQDASMRLNIFSLDPRTGTQKQLTRFTDFDVSYLAGGPANLVFEYGGDLYLMDPATETFDKVIVQVMSDLSAEIPRIIDVSRQISDATAAPGGRRVVFEARGELFNVPVKEGYTLNFTQSSGAFDRQPSWSPDGKTIAYWSDRSGEYEIYLQPTEPGHAPKKLSNRGKGFGYQLFWAPDSEKIAFMDENNDIFVIAVATGELTKVDHTNWNIGHGGRFRYPLSWSPDSKWIAYTRGLENAHYAVMVYGWDTQEVHQLTAGYYNDAYPVFSTDGKYLFYMTDRNFGAAYSALNDGTWIYPNATHLAALSLLPGTPALTAPRNDEISSGREAKAAKDSVAQVRIDVEQIESRLTLLPVDPGNFGALMAFEGKLVFLRQPNTGSEKRGSSLMLYDLEKREEKSIMDNVGRANATADGKAILVQSGGRYGIIQPAPGQKIESPIAVSDLKMAWTPKEEWEQIFADTWRRYRDFFYDPNMHGVDWNALRVQYGALLKDARTRWDVINLQSNLAAELSAGHTYTRGGDTEEVEPKATGLLGIDWKLDRGKYVVKRIVRPAPWNTEVRSPFDRPGVDVQVGDAILSVNGIPLDPAKDPYAAFEGLSGKTVALTLSRSGEPEAAKTIVVECLTPAEENNLRYLEWLEDNRKMVERLSNGQLGYVYMSNTSGQGQLELVSMYYGQLDKKGFIIDERFNGGGQLADRFLELLKRPVVYNLHWRHGRDHTQPIKANTGPMGMLINGWAGSGGDGLPWAFQELKAGPIVGERTLGILVGPATGHSLIDGGGITVPDARLYDNDGHWFWEGEGVSPDIEVWDDPNLLMQGRDPQMERVVQEVLQRIPTQSSKMTPAPKPDDRTAKGLNGKN